MLEQRRSPLLISAKRSQGLDLCALKRGITDNRLTEYGQHVLFIVRDQLIHRVRVLIKPALETIDQCCRIREGRLT